MNLVLTFWTQRSDLRSQIILSATPIAHKADADDTTKNIPQGIYYKNIFSRITHNTSIHCETIISIANVTLGAGDIQPLH